MISSARNPACKITGGAGLKLPNLKCDKNGLKRHFFYHPVRVNKELIDEELPCPDTVRNVRKLFEGSSLLRVRSVSKDNIAVNTSTLAIQSVLSHAHNTHSATVLPSQVKPVAVAAATTPAVPVTSSLAVDTSNSVGVGGGGGGGGIIIRPKWDAASLSSGVSSGELSSPCECIDLGGAEMGNHHASIYEAEDQLDEGKCCDPSYVSQVVRREWRATGEEKLSNPNNNKNPLLIPSRTSSRRSVPAAPLSRTTGARCWTSGRAPMASCKISTKIDALLASPSTVPTRTRSTRK